MKVENIFDPIEALSAGVAKDGSGYFSSNACVITSESAIHLSSTFTIGTLPSGLISNNLTKQHKNGDSGPSNNEAEKHPLKTI